jgi:integrase
VWVHDLRHSWSALAPSAGVHQKIVQERLGHAAIAITLDVHSHVTEGLHGGAAAVVAGMIGRVSCGGQRGP